MKKVRQFKFQEFRQFKFQEFTGFVTKRGIFTFGNYKFDDSQPWKYNLEAIIYEFIEQDYSELTLINSNGYLFDNVMVIFRGSLIPNKFYTPIDVLTSEISPIDTILDLDKGELIYLK